jgi:3-phenylpropionate/trans-cinnamate dioxygenase ferredoxin reductase component
LIVRGSLEQRKFVAFYLKGGRILATVGMNRGKDVRQSMGLIKAGIQVDLARLRDEAIQVRDLASG